MMQEIKGCRHSTEIEYSRNWARIRKKHGINPRVRMAAMNRHTPGYGRVVTAVQLFILPAQTHRAISKPSEVYSRKLESALTSKRRECLALYCEAT